MDACRPECEPLLLLTFYDTPLIFGAILSFGGFNTKPSLRFVEFPRRIDN
jgi:hypothetical protein